jgi:hypothetical protein
MNLGLSEELSAAFEEVVPMERPEVTDYTIKDPN